MLKDTLKKNKWKLLFFTLAGLNLAMLIWFFSYLFVFPADPPQTYSSQNEHLSAKFTVHSTKENLNLLINTYLNQLPKNEIYNYSVNINRHVELSGTIMAFGRSVPIHITMEPYVLNNGDLILNVQSITLGKLPLPNKKVLKYIRDYYHLPDWIMIDPDKHRVYAAVTEMETKSQFDVRVEKFDPANNEFSFQIFVSPDSFDLDDLEKVF
ncbi:MAG: YpmS family protein [Bacillaceae bacterium]|nr:YpmS family protein [Bacillaceae bacterium]